ncbi:transposase family protein [Streptomyces mirabilis]|uniref:transposase family protein n=1 Tax=Streptomyces mirabilis TaxID=68239 RepID=UPI0033FDE27E
MPDPRDPRGVRHALVAVLALTACAVLVGGDLCAGSQRVDRRRPAARITGVRSYSYRQVVSSAP